MVWQEMEFLQSHAQAAVSSTQALVEERFSCYTLQDNTDTLELGPLHEQLNYTNDTVCN